MTNKRSAIDSWNSAAIEPEIAPSEHRDQPNLRATMSDRHWSRRRGRQVRPLLARLIPPRIRHSSTLSPAAIQAVALIENEPCRYGHDLAALYGRAVRESVQLEVGAEVQQRCFQRGKHQPRPIHPVLAHLRADDREQAAAHTHIARRGRSMGATVRGCHAAPVQSRKEASAG
jgi:hypothetical protein